MNGRLMLLSLFFGAILLVRGGCNIVTNAKADPVELMVHENVPLEVVPGNGYISEGNWNGTQLYFPPEGGRWEISAIKTGVKTAQIRYVAYDVNGVPVYEYPYATDIKAGVKYEYMGKILKFNFNSIGWSVKVLK